MNASAWHWTMLLLAALAEIAWVVAMKYSEGLTRLWPTLATAAAAALALVALGLAVREIPVAVAYALWMGLGMVGVTILSAWLWGETLGWIQLACLALILTGGVGLKLSGSG